jgi:peptide/nickel transport system substrate-binding protein
VTAGLGGTPAKGGTVSVTLPSAPPPSWIFPFYAITNASVYNGQLFQWLMYRPLYMFGNNRTGAGRLRRDSGSTK